MESLVGVKIILNINELQEFSLNMINWDVITKYYPEKDFELIDFQIFNNNDSDPRQKIRYAAFILHNLIIDSKVNPLPFFSPLLSFFSFTSFLHLFFLSHLLFFLFH